ncbi:hypothetical protein CVO77_13095 [Sphingopyxis lindanitolerans]|uniref:EthD domain-containing protein n=1 Tax=Sphingopyxis lindanitolerans TaxID=2054227 RepID=A0A2S8B113_9SPHN|nr:EthD domain-containing protein [Sphingopyxis lindanitolerans]PQM26033.1 hypothetical protein CVO77_13095 [Sphingopyxis lindanitolerans]
MFKFIIAFERHPGLTRDETHEYLSAVHGPLVASVPEFCRHVRGYVQNFVFEAGIAPGEFAIDGAAELWFDSPEIFIAAYAEPRYLEQVRPDEPRFANPDRMVAAFTSETVLIDKPLGGGAKLIRFLAAVDGTSDAEFVAQWQRLYGEAIVSDRDLSALPVKYIQNWSTPRASNPFPLARDFVGVDELWFENDDGLRRFLAIDQEILRSLEHASILDTAASVSFAAKEKRVLP